MTFFLSEYTGEGSHEIDSDELEKTGWFTFDDAMKTLTYEDSGNVLEKAFNYIQSLK